jgi:hypothetical protein
MKAELGIGLLPLFNHHRTTKRKCSNRSESHVSVLDMQILGRGKKPAGSRRRAAACLLPATSSSSLGYAALYVAHHLLELNETQ